METKNFYVLRNKHTGLYAGDYIDKDSYADIQHTCWYRSVDDAVSAFAASGEPAGHWQIVRMELQSKPI